MWGLLSFLLIFFLISLSFFRLILALRASKHFSLSLSLSLSLFDETQVGASRQAVPYRNGFFFFFLVCDLMVDSVVVVWVIDLAFLIWLAWASELRVDRRGLLAKSFVWVSNSMGLSQWLFFFFLFRLLVVMRLWVCDLVVILLFFLFFFWLLVVNGDEVVGLGLWFGYDFSGSWSWLWVVVTVAVVVAAVALVGGFILFFCFRWWWPAVASHGCGFAKRGVSFQRKGETKRKK